MTVLRFERKHKVKTIILTKGLMSPVATCYTVGAAKPIF